MQRFIHGYVVGEIFGEIMDENCVEKNNIIIEETGGKIEILAAEVVAKLGLRGWQIAFAESCTGGMLASAITEVSGSSEVFQLGVVSYSDHIKNEILGVDDFLLAEFTAVSAVVATEMAVGILNLAAADIGVSVTGIAGPSGGSATKPVGLVYICVATKAKCEVYENVFEGNRSQVRLQAVEFALKKVLEEM